MYFIKGPQLIDPESIKGANKKEKFGDIKSLDALNVPYFSGKTWEEVMNSIPHEIISQLTNYYRNLKQKIAI